MKVILELGTLEYIIKFHELNLYLEKDGSMKYLFDIRKNNYPKKYLLDIDLNDFKSFIKECLTYGINKVSQYDYDSTIIQLFNKYEMTQDLNLKLLINKKIGNLILSNSKFKNFYYLKSLEKFFYNNNITESLIYNKQHSQIKYLIIIINNFISLKKSNKNYNDKNTFDILDFIYDYYVN